MRIRSVLSAVVLALVVATPALAQSDQTTDPREFTEAGRKAYAQTLKDARTLIADKKYPEAIVLLDQLTVERPREPQARFLKGLALADSGKTDAAIAAFQDVLGDYPELPEPHNNLAVLYARRGDLALARDELEAAISAAPDYVVAYENLGDIYARLAATNYEKAVTRDARNKTAPAKLKLVREVLAPATPAATATPPTPVAPAATTAPTLAPAATDATTTPLPAPVATDATTTPLPAPPATDTTAVPPAPAN